MPESERLFNAVCNAIKIGYGLNQETVSLPQPNVPTLLFAETTEQAEAMALCQSADRDCFELALAAKASWWQSAGNLLQLRCI